MIAGEWAVLEGYPCIVAAVSRKVCVEIEAAEDMVEERPFVKEAVEKTLEYLGESKSFRITTGKVEKVGLGSSAAVTVAVVGAVLQFHGRAVEKDVVYQIAAAAHYAAQGGKGSGFDVAASVYGGVIAYKHRGEGMGEVTSLPIPTGLQLLVGWTGEAASTTEMMKEMGRWKEQHREEYDQIMSAIGKTVEELIAAWKEDNKDQMIMLLKKNRELLQELGAKSGVQIETAVLKKLSDIADKHGAGKVSGAGGGDCGIAVVSDLGRQIKVEWKKEDIMPLDVHIDEKGVEEDEGEGMCLTGLIG